MTRRFPTGFLALVLALLAGCATPTPYQPALEEGGYGYDDFLLEDGKYRVVFRGNSQTSRERVENSVCYRAADLTVLAGYDHFVVLDEQVEAFSEYRTVGTGVAGAGFGPGFGTGFGYGVRGGFYSGIWSTQARTQERRRYWAGAIIQLGHGPKPDLPNAYDAREVLAALGEEVLDLPR